MGCFVGLSMKNILKFSVIFFTSGILILASLFYYTNIFGSHIILHKTSFKNLPGWADDDQNKALYAFKQSCIAIMRMDPKKPFSHSIPFSGNVSAWQTICEAANNFMQNDTNTARDFFEYWFKPYRVENNFNPKGLFTGYYLPLIHASYTKNQRYTAPIYAMPSDLYKIKLGLFHSELTGKTITVKLKDNILTPYPDRAAIQSGVLGNKAHVLAWADNPIDIFFAQIQGSAVVQMSNQKKLVIGYAGDNGHPYTAVGKILVAKHFIEKNAVSMQSIKTWLMQHPELASDILNQNASYVFFNILKNGQVLGTQHVPLTPERSLAVDTRYIPLGAPVWLKTTSPMSAKNKVPFQQLLIAQDTGGAIKGIIRGDVFWGEGDEAAFNAGYMNSVGQYWILLPRRMLT
jgi:membrane-bound lytic murein transglycosylase A